MRRRNALFVLLTFLSAVCASCSSAAQPTPSTTTPLPCDVERVIANRCQACHQSPPLYGAPMPLVTWEDLHAPSRTNPNLSVYEAIELRIHDLAHPMPQPPNAPLSGEASRTLDQWIAMGAPKGAACAPDAGGLDTADAGDASVDTLGCTPDLAIAPISPYSMPADLDNQYVCYGFEAPPDQATAGAMRHAVALAPRVDNHTILHHAILYQSDVAQSGVPTACSPTAALSWRTVFGWAPGGNSYALPDNVGFPYNASTHWVVQLHYNNVNHLSGQTDQSGFSLCTTDKAVRYDADVVAFGTQKIDVLPHTTLDQSCGVKIPRALDGVHLFSAFPHMHRHGAAIETELVEADAGTVSLGRSNPFNFQEQVWEPIDATLREGDIVKTRCVWTNETGSDVTFGPNTEDEMCYSFTAYYPRLLIPGFSWSTPSQGSTCVSTSSALDASATSTPPSADAGATMP